jgi:hypothetical protein
MRATLQYLLPLAGVLDGGTATHGEINLARGENLLLENELLRLCKEAVGGKLVTEDVSPIL